MRKAFTLAVGGLLVIGATAAWKAQHDRHALQERARVSPEAARAAALGSVPGGKILESELEEEDGRLIYSFDIEAADVEIDAITGQVLQSGLENEVYDHADDERDDRKAEQR